MKKILPTYGITVHEIPRKTTDGKDDIISAKKVRNALKAGDFETLKKHVPQTTLDYLKENYDKLVKALNEKG